MKEPSIISPERVVESDYSDEELDEMDARADERRIDSWKDGQLYDRLAGGSV